MTDGTYSDAQVEAAIEYAKREKCEKDLYFFMSQCWSVIEGGKPFVGGWAAQVMCEHLEAVYHGDIKRLLMNLPPRTGKSNLLSVIFPVWCWLQNPGEQLFTISYSEKLAMRDNVRARRLILSPWFQKRWGHRFQLSEDQSTKLRVDNMQGGYRVVAGVDGTVLGEGGSLLICLPFETMICSNMGALSIGDIVENKIKCKILSYNHDTCAIEYKEIEEYEKTQGRELYEIECADGSVFQCTGEHPVYVEGRGYVHAMDVAEGDVLWSVDMTSQEIKTRNGGAAQ